MLSAPLAVMPSDVGDTAGVGAAGGDAVGARWRSTLSAPLAVMPVGISDDDRIGLISISVRAADGNSIWPDRGEAVGPCDGG